MKLIKLEVLAVFVAVAAEEPDTDKTMLDPAHFSKIQKRTLGMFQESGLAESCIYACRKSRALTCARLDAYAISVNKKKTKPLWSLAEQCSIACQCLRLGCSDCKTVKKVLIDRVQLHESVAERFFKNSAISQSLEFLGRDIHHYLIDKPAEFIKNAGHSATEFLSLVVRKALFYVGSVIVFVMVIYMGFQHMTRKHSDVQVVVPASTGVAGQDTSAV